MALNNTARRKPYQIQLPQQATDIDTMFEQLYRRIADLEDALATGGGGGSSAPTALLDGVQHPDTTAGAPVTGDLISAQASKWARKAVGAAGQHLVVVAGEPAWSNDGSGLTGLDATDLVGVVPTASVLHDMLSAHHQDSVPASAVIGDVIVAVDATAAAADPYVFWGDGFSFDYLSTPIDNGGLPNWINGLPASGLLAVTSAKWQRLAKGTAGQVLVATATGIGWQAPTGATSAGDPVAAHAQQAGAITVAHLSTTMIAHGATSFDTGPFWNGGFPTRLTIPTGQSGVYSLLGQVDGETMASTDKLVLCILKNGIIVAANDSLGGGRKQVKAIVSAVAGDYLELQLYCERFTAPGTCIITGGANSTFLQIAKMMTSTTIGSVLPNPNRGVLVKGNAASTAYEALTVGAAGQVLLSDGNDPGWSSRPTLRDVAEAVSGVFDFTNGLRERGRAAKMGEWTDIAHNAANFTGNGGMTWTVDVGDQVGFAYTVIGKTALIRFTLNGTSVGAVSSSQLLIDITSTGLTALVNSSNIVRCFNAGVDGAGLAEVVGAQIRLSLFTGNWTLVVNNTSIQGVVIFTIA